MKFFVEYMLFIQILFVFVIPFMCVLISGRIAPVSLGLGFFLYSGISFCLALIHN
jgi:hypothetical protein